MTKPVQFLQRLLHHPLFAQAADKHPTTINNSLPPQLFHESKQTIPTPTPTPTPSPSTIPSPYEETSPLTLRQCFTILPWKIFSITPLKAISTLAAVCLTGGVAYSLAKYYFPASDITPECYTALHTFKTAPQGQQQHEALSTIFTHCKHTTLTHTAEQIIDPHWRDQAFTFIAKSSHQAGRCSHSLAAATQINNLVHKESVLHPLCHQCSETAFKPAELLSLEHAASNTAEWLRDDCAAFMVKAYLNSDDCFNALMTANKITNIQRKDKILLNICEKCLDPFFLDQITESMSDEAMRDDAYRLNIHTQLAKGNFTNALESFKKIRGPSSQLKILPNIFEKCPDPHPQYQFAMSIHNAFDRNAVLHELCKRSQRLPDIERIAASIDEPLKRDLCYQDFINAQLTYENTTPLALAAFKKMYHASSQFEALATIFDQCIDQAIQYEFAMSISNDYYRNRALHRIAEKCQNLAQLDKITQGFDDLREKDESYFKFITTKLQQANYGEALQAFQKINRPYSQYEALTTIFEKCKERAQRQRFIDSIADLDFRAKATSKWMPKIHPKAKAV